MDIASVSTALTSIKAASDIAKVIKEGYISLDKAEVKLQMAELISKLADAKIEVAEIQQFLIEKDTEIHELNNKLKVKENIQFERPFYFLIEKDLKDGPFCQAC